MLDIISHYAQGRELAFLRLGRGRGKEIQNRNEGESGA